MSAKDGVFSLESEPEFPRVNFVSVDGGPAFPGAFTRLNNYNEVVERSFQNGMTLRDYFAAHASDDDIFQIINYHGSPITRQQARYIHADAMLAARGAA